MTDVLDTLGSYPDDASIMMSKRVVADVIDEIARLRAERDALREAAQSLARSVSGSWYAFERALRSEIGNTNYNCVAEKLARIDAALNGDGDGSETENI